MNKKEYKETKLPTFSSWCEFYYPANTPLFQSPDFNLFPL